MAQEECSQMFEAVRRKFGFVPNLVRELCLSPAVARVYLGGQDAMAAASLTAREQQAVQLAVAVYNECGYCRAAHRRGAVAAGIASGDVDAIAQGQPPDDPRLRSLTVATWQVLDTKGWLGEADLAALAQQGVDRVQLYEIIALVGLKTISNYVNHIAHTEVDAAFREAAPHPA